MKFKKIIRITGVLALAVVMATGCGGGAPAGGDGDDEGGFDGTIKIGINYELSGGVATYGQASLDGITLAIEEVNAAGGVNGKELVLVTMDNKSDDAEAYAISTRLMTQDGVVAVLGPATSGRFKAALQASMEYEVPGLSGSATADDVTMDANGVKEFAFRICFSDSFQGTTMANFASNNLSASKAFIYMDSSSDYGKGLAKNFKETFIANGGEIVAEEAYVAGDKDFNAVLTSIKAKDHDVIFIPGYYEEAGLIINQARGMGIDAPILGADGFDSPVLLELAGADALNDVYFSNHYSSLDNDPMVLAFIDSFNDMYGQDPNAFHALGYDMGLFIADALSRAADDSDPIAVRDAMAATSGFAGVTGTITVDANHTAVKSVVVIELANGEQVSSEKVDP